MDNISVCVVDDNKQLRKTLEEIFLFSDGFSCIGLMGTAEEAIIQIPSLKPDIVLMDINLGGRISGIDCIRLLRPRTPASRFMICTVYEENEKIFNALSAGASAYILKKTGPQRLMDSIRDLYEGGSPMSSPIARKVVATFQNIPVSPKWKDLDRLTIREKQVLELLAKGLMYKEIASSLFLAHETIRKHVYHIYEKLHVRNRIAAVNKYYGL